MLTIPDTGIGILPEVMKQVFEPFFTIKKRGEGTGLGLSTMFGVVKQSGGNIWVYSEPGKGTTFKIYLPRVDTPLDEGVAKGAKRDFPGGGESILVVEDEETVRKLTVRLLTHQGYKVLEARHWEDAVALCEGMKEPIHLILTDVVKPEVNGPQLMERLKTGAPGLQSALHVGLYRQHDSQNGNSRKRDLLSPETFYPVQPAPESAGSAGQMNGESGMRISECGIGIAE